MSSQNKLTRHKVSHIQAFYTAQAAVNYAIEKFRMGNDPLWPASGTYTRTMCNIGCDVVEPFLPGVIQSVVIVVSDVGTGPENTRQIKATVIYK